MTDIWHWLTENIPYTRAQILFWWIGNLLIGFWLGRRR